MIPDELHIEFTINSLHALIAVYIATTFVIGVMIQRKECKAKEAGIRCGDMIAGIFLSILAPLYLPLWLLGRVAYIGIKRDKENFWA